jgi:HSP20 family protein
MTFMRYEPWSVVSQLQNDINRVFGNMGSPDNSSATADWVPAVDVREYVDRFELLVDLPGVAPSDVEITLDNSVLTLAGERSEAGSEEPGSKNQLQHQRLGRPTGHFHRRFILPDTVDAQKVNAAGRNGVLAISIAKQAKSQPRRITVK